MIVSVEHEFHTFIQLYTRAGREDNFSKYNLLCKLARHDDMQKDTWWFTITRLSTRNLLIQFCVSLGLPSYHRACAASISFSRFTFFLSRFTWPFLHPSSFRNRWSRTRTRSSDSLFFFSIAAASSAVSFLVSLDFFRLFLVFSSLSQPDLRTKMYIKRLYLGQTSRAKTICLVPCFKRTYLSINILSANSIFIQLESLVLLNSLSISFIF